MLFPALVKVFFQEAKTGDLFQANAFTVAAATPLAMAGWLRCQPGRLKQLGSSVPTRKECYTDLAATSPEVHAPSTCAERWGHARIRRELENLPLRPAGFTVSWQFENVWASRK